MKVVLINIGFQPGEAGLKVSPPFGIMSVGAYLRSKGHDVTLLDWSGEEVGEDQRRELRSLRPRLVGFHVKISSSIHRAVEASGWAKEAGATVMWGGAGPTIIPDVILRDGPVDVAVMGEGERTAQEITEALDGKRDLSAVPGIAYVKDGRVARTAPRERFRDLNALPMPLWEDLGDLSRYFTPLHGRNAVPLITSRGCPGHCTFCYTKAMWGYQWIALSPEKVVDEMERIMSLDHRIGGFLIIDDLFAASPRRVQMICDLIIERGLDIRWNCELRADLIREEMLGPMKAAGCRQVLIGVESGSQRLLDLVRKDITVDDIRRACALLHEAGIEVYAMMVNRLPTETEEDIRATERLLKEIRPEYTEFLIYSPYPGTPLFDEAVQNGFRPPATLEGWGHLGTFSMNQLGDKRLEGADGRKYEKLARRTRRRAKVDSYVQEIMREPLTAPARGIRLLTKQISIKQAKEE